MTDGMDGMDGMDGQPPQGDWLGTKHLRFERHGPLARCVVDRPEKRNAMTGAMYFGVRYASNRVDADPDLAGMLLTGTGDVFIPGGDLGDGSTDEWNIGEFLFMDTTPFDALRQAHKPVVSAVNGICQGGGLMMAMLSDVTVASERATFRAPELLRGIADTNYAQILPRQIGPSRARDMLLTGRTVTAEEALEWGLVSRLVPHDDLLDAATEALIACCRTAPGARSDIKRSLDQYYGLYDRIGMISSLRGPETTEGFLAFKERRNPSWVHPDLRTDGRL
ncbi:MAG: enoyl-CoA hydratase/isomerase family protein [Actinomycetota bacterium]|nr:enoyl-CoA hydratase/isomerase family protein [Actinomycetota bacterium]